MFRAAAPWRRIWKRSTVWLWNSARRRLLRPTNVWLSLRQQFENEGIIREADPREADPGARYVILPRNARQPGWWQVFQRPSLAGAFLTAGRHVAAGMIGYGSSTQVSTHPQLRI